MINPFALVHALGEVLEHTTENTTITCNTNDSWVMTKMGNGPEMMWKVRHVSNWDKQYQIHRYSKTTNEVVFSTPTSERSHEFHVYDLKEHIREILKADGVVLHSVEQS